LTPDSIKQKYPQAVVSTRIVPGCVQFWGRKNVFTQSGSKTEELEFGRAVLQQDQAVSAYRHRYDKLAANYLAFVKLAAVRIWLGAYESTP